MREPGEFVLSDGILGRAVEGIVTRRRRERRAQRYLIVGWDETAAALVRLNVDHPMRLWLVLQLQTKLEQPGTAGSNRRRQLLDQIELPLQCPRRRHPLGTCRADRGPTASQQTCTGEAGSRSPRAGDRPVKRDLHKLFRTARRGAGFRHGGDHWKLKHQPTGASHLLRHNAILPAGRAQLASRRAQSRAHHAGDTMTMIQAIAFAVILGFAVLGALEFDRRLASCGGLILAAGERP